MVIPIFNITQEMEYIAKGQVFEMLMDDLPQFRKFRVGKVRNSGS